MPVQPPSFLGHILSGTFLATSDSATWLSNQPIRRKLILAFALVLTTFVIAVVAIFVGLDMQADAQQWSHHTREVITELTEAEQAVHVADVSVRKFNISGEEVAVTEYLSALDRFDQHLDKALSLTVDAAEQQVLLSHVRERAERWRNDIAGPLVASIRSKGGANRAEHAYEQGLPYLRAAGTAFADIDTAFASAVASEQDKLVARDERLSTTTRSLRLLVALMLALGVSTGIAAVVLVSRSIGEPIRRLTTLMSRLAGGDRGIEVTERARRDEIGEVARALQVFKEAALETHGRNWVKANIAEIAGALQACVDREAFARALTAEVAPRLKAGVAVFYAADGERELALLGSWGFRQRKHLATRYAPGEGLIGQVALERAPILLEQVPDDYVRIHSGLGEAPPRTIAALPLLLKERLLGVLEIGSFAPFDAFERQLLDELLPLAALSLENINRADDTRRLLETTRQQARELQTSEEELRVQQEELAATNEELQGKTVELEEQQQRLRASEEELRVQAEELQASNEELRQKTDTLVGQKQLLESLQQETEQKAQELAKASQYKSDFLANMSHELRTPLNSLLILSRNLADNAGGNLDFEQVESARVIHESGTNLLRLINDILDLAKIEAGKMHAVAEDVPLADWTQALTRRFRHVADEKALQFEVALDGGLPVSIRTDGARLEQIANNLVGNAFKFTRHGSVGVRIGRPGAELAARLGLDAAGAIAVEVADTGIGIPADKIEHIFGTFEQMDASTSRKYGGSGLGLAIARRLAELLGGGIDVASAPGEGSRFTIVLPERLDVADAGTAQFADDPAPAPPPAGPQRGATPMPRPATAPAATTPLPKPWVPDDRDALREGETVILAIEDDPLFARTLVDMIRRKGYRALAAGDGESGLYLARQYRPTGILLDVMLPGIDGWAVIDRLKRDRATRHIPVHFVSAVDEAARAQAAGAVGFLTKPVEREAVLAAFERLLRSSAGAKRRVLLIDDDPDSRVAINTLVKADNIEIVEAASAESGLQYLDSGPFDCIVLDLGLPGMSGIEFLELVAARGPLPPIVIHSGRELCRDESARLRQYTDSIVIKGTRSLERLLDEVSLFLHSVRKDAAPHVVRDIDDSLSGRVALVVDDDMRNIFALSKILREKGLTVVMAQDGAKALRQLDENPAIEIVLMDVMMPGMDGYETMREIRKRPALAKLPVIAVTAKAMSGDRDKCLTAGADDYLSKPIDIDRLLSMMRTWLHA